MVILSVRKAERKGAKFQQGATSAQSRAPSFRDELHLAFQHFAREAVDREVYPRSGFARYHKLLSARSV